MRENFLHHIWQFKKFSLHSLKSVNGEKIEILNTGNPNFDAGPDFSFCKICIDGILWTGNVEIHIKSSDWEKHNHSENSNYQNIILHVVYEYDKEILLLKQKNIPTLELKNYISEEIINHYQSISCNHFRFIPCENLFSSYYQKDMPGFAEKLYLEKLEAKCEKIMELNRRLKGDWESVLACTLAYSFGLKINAEIFEQLLLNLDYKIIRKISQNPFSTEALFFGQCDLLVENQQDEYCSRLFKEYEYLKSKFNLEPFILKPKFLRLRPANFPTLRLSQFAHLLSLYQNLFSYIIGVKKLKDYELLLEEVQASEYWENHYVFGKINQKKSKKKLSSSQKNLLILNTFLPVKFAYAQSIGKSMDEEIIEIISQIPPEKNSVIESFKDLSVKFCSALDSQAFLHLYKNYCAEKRCLQCPIGYKIVHE
ncbi:MAG: DUF2851 family protein [Flavobacteriaceae bacterium]|jgi:hypothetical protein|nr:DUF2851 family protein [Flavobacteriaceae bacterium]